MPRILTLDIETAPIEAYVWRIRDENIGLEQIKEDWSILAFAAKWIDQKAVTYSDTSGRGAKKIRDDKKLCRQLHALLDEADIVVCQNGKRFDLPKINSRLLLHGFKPPSPVRVVDTYLVDRRIFGHTSNKLAWVSKVYTDAPKSDHKHFPGFELWAECLKDNPRAWREMRKYNIRDVVATEKLYMKIRPWIDGHPNMAAYSSTTKSECPKCGHGVQQARGFSVTQAGRYQRFQCQGCGGWSRGKANALTPDKRRALHV